MLNINIQLDLFFLGTFFAKKTIFIDSKIGLKCKKHYYKKEGANSMNKLTAKEFAKELKIAEKCMIIDMEQSARDAKFIIDTMLKHKIELVKINTINLIRLYGKKDNCKRY
jgi:hypothetical protein